MDESLENIEIQKALKHYKNIKKHVELIITRDIILMKSLEKNIKH